MAASCLHEPKFLHLRVDHLIVYSTWCGGGGGFIPSFLLFALWWFLLFSPQTCIVSTCVLCLPPRFPPTAPPAASQYSVALRPHEAEPGQSSPDGYGRWTCSRVCVCCWKLLKIFSFSPLGFWKSRDTRSQLCVGVDDISDSEGRGTVTWGQPTIWLYFSTTPCQFKWIVSTIRKSNLWNSPVVSWMHPVKKGKSYDDFLMILPVKLLQCISLSAAFDPRLFNHIPGCVGVCVCAQLVVVNTCVRV